MATRFYRVDTLGKGGVEDVTEAGSAGVVFVEAQVVYDATGANKTQVLKALEAIGQYILRDTFPPV